MYSSPGFGCKTVYRRDSPKVILRLWKRHDISGFGLPVAEQVISALLPASNVTLVSSLLNSMSSADNNQKL